ncbi:MAG: MbcA/ParS/Xre antitoxin family protein [Roseicyclus sp.]
MHLVQPAGPDTLEPPVVGPYTAPEIEAMQRTVINLFARWGVSDTDAAVILGNIAPKTFRRWKVGQYGRVNRDLADRLSHLIGIHKALRMIYAEPARGYAWMQRPNADLDGLSPVALLLRGSMADLVRLRRYLDSARGGW